MQIHGAKCVYHVVTITFFVAISIADIINVILDLVVEPHTICIRASMLTEPG